MMLNGENFQKEVLEEKLPVLVDFYADWCGPCKMMAPVVEQLADKYAGQIKVGKVNVDDEIFLAQKYRVASIPTFVIFKDGQAVETMVGGMPAAQLEAKIKEYV